MKILWLLLLILVACFHGSNTRPRQEARRKLGGNTDHRFPFDRTEHALRGAGAKSANANADNGQHGASGARMPTAFATPTEGHWRHNNAGRNPGGRSSHKNGGGEAFGHGFDDIPWIDDDPAPIFAGSHRDNAPVKVMDVGKRGHQNGGGGGFGHGSADRHDTAPIFAGSHRESAPVKVMDVAKANEEVEAYELQEQTPTPSRIGRAIDWYAKNTGLRKKEGQTSSLNKRWVQDAHEMAYGVIKEDENFGALLHLESTVREMQRLYGRRYRGEQGERRAIQDASFLIKRPAIRFGVRAAKDAARSLFSGATSAAEEYAITMGTGPVAPVIARGSDRAVAGAIRYYRRGELPLQKNRIGPGRYLHDFRRGTLRKIRNPKNIAPLMIRCIIVGPCKIAGGIVGGAVGTLVPIPVVGTAVGAAVGTTIAGKLAERFISIPLETLTRNGIRGLQESGRPPLQTAAFINSVGTSIYSNRRTGEQITVPSKTLAEEEDVVRLQNGLRGPTEGK